jgi:LysM repeat protein
MRFLGSTICLHTKGTGRRMDLVASIHLEKPSRRTAGRMLAISALALAVIGVIMAVVLGNVGSSDSGGTGSADRAKQPYHVVRAGDDLSTIAAREGVPKALIRRLNPSLDPLAIQPENCVNLVPHGCRRLAGPKPNSHPAGSPPSPKDPSYVVRSGDSFASIAAKEGVPLATITRLNPKLSSAALQPGDCVALTRNACAESGAGSPGSATRSRAFSRAF